MRVAISFRSCQVCFHYEFKVIGSVDKEELVHIALGSRVDVRACLSIFCEY